MYWTDFDFFQDSRSVCIIVRCFYRLSNKLPFKNFEVGELFANASAFFVDMHGWNKVYFEVNCLPLPLILEIQYNLWYCPAVANRPRSLIYGKSLFELILIAGLCIKADIEIWGHVTA